MLRGKYPRETFRPASLPARRAFFRAGGEGLPKDIAEPRRRAPRKADKARSALAGEDSEAGATCRLGFALRRAMALRSAIMERRLGYPARKEASENIIAALANEIGASDLGECIRFVEWANGFYAGQGSMSRWAPPSKGPGYVGPTEFLSMRFWVEAMNMARNRWNSYGRYSDLEKEAGDCSPAPGDLFDDLPPLPTL